MALETLWVPTRRFPDLEIHTNLLEQVPERARRLLGRIDVVLSPVVHRYPEDGIASVDAKYIRSLAGAVADIAQQTGVPALVYSDRMLDLSCLPGRVVNARDRLVSLVVAAAVPWPERMYEQEGPAVSLVEHVHRRAVVLANEDLRNLGQAFQFGWVAADVPPAGDYTPEDNFFDD